MMGGDWGWWMALGKWAASCLVGGMASVLWQFPAGRESKHDAKACMAARVH